jgi:hypothetical protein
MRSLTNFFQPIVARMVQLRGMGLSLDQKLIRDGAIAQDFYFLLTCSLPMQSLYATSKI